MRYYVYDNAVFHTLHSFSWWEVMENLSTEVNND